VHPYQALSALLFLYREVLQQPLAEDLALTFAKRPALIVDPAKRRSFINSMESQNGQAPGGVAFEVQRALQLLTDVPRLLQAANASERLALVKSLFDQIWVEDRRIARLTPRADVGPVIAALVRVLDGVPDGARTRNILIHSQVLCH
jgi:hypothetical protein